ncbi:MAG: TolC family protein [Candidatus Eisenbacteria bacterium]
MRSVFWLGVLAWAGLLALSSRPAVAAKVAAPAPDSLVAIALSRAPALAALRARVDEAHELERPAGALPNPMVELMMQDIDFPRWTVGEEDMSMIGPQITQGIPFPGKRGARRQVAIAEVRVREQDLELLRRVVARDIRSLYARLYAADREQQSLAYGHELLGVMAATVRDRYSAGVAEGEPMLKAQLVQARVAERIDDLAAERSGLVAAMNRLLDAPGDASIGEVTLLPVPLVPPMPWQDVALQGSVEVAKRRAEVQAAERKLRAAGLERWPDFVAGAGIGFRGEKDPAVTLRLGLDLPLWSGQNQTPMVRAAAQNLQATRESLRDAESAARAEATRLEADWTNAQHQVARYAEAIVPHSSLALDAARSGYLVGRTDFSTVVEDFDLWLKARTGQAAREAARYVTWAELQLLIAPPVPTDAKRSGR